MQLILVYFNCSSVVEHSAVMISVMNKSLYSSAASVAVATATAALGSSSGAPSETQSEISSVESNWSDIKAIALKLGVSDPDDLHTERFKVDRQKLEQLIQGKVFSNKIQQHLLISLCFVSPFCFNTLKYLASLNY